MPEFTEVSYHSSDDNLEDENILEEEMIFEEIEDDEEVEDEEISYASSNSGSGISDEEEIEVSDDNDGGNDDDKGGDGEQLNSTAPVKAKAPAPLHKLLHEKLRNTNVRISDAKRKSVKDMAAAFVAPRPSSFARRAPISLTTETPKSPQQNQSESPQKQQPQKKYVPQSTLIKRNPPAGTSKFSPQKIKSPLGTKAEQRTMKLPPTRLKSKSAIGTSPTKTKTRKKPIDAKVEAPQDTMIDESEVKSSRNGSDSSSSWPTTSGDESNSSSSSSPSISSVGLHHSTSSPPNMDSQKNEKSNNEDSSSSNENPTNKSEIEEIFKDSEHSSSFSFSVSSGTDQSLAAKLGDLGTPFAPLPIAANFISDDTNHTSGSMPLKPLSHSRSNNQDSDSSSSDPSSSDDSDDPDLKKPVSWGDLLGEVDKNETKAGAEVDLKDSGNNDNEGDDDDTDDSESYETASTDEFETDTERSKSVGPIAINLNDLQEDIESAETSDYETDTTYEREHAESEGRTPPPPKKPIIDPNTNKFRSMKSQFDPMPEIEENEEKDQAIINDSRSINDTPASDFPVYELEPERSRRRKPFENIPTDVAAEIRQRPKVESEESENGPMPLGIMGWDGKGDSKEGGNGESPKHGGGNIFNRIFKKTDNIDTEESNTDPEDSPIPLPPSPPPYDPPNYDDIDDEISNLTDKVFSPKKSKQEHSLDSVEEEEALSKESSDTSGRFSITRFRSSNSIRNTERALEDLNTTSLEPEKNKIRNARSSHADLASVSSSNDFGFRHSHDVETERMENGLDTHNAPIIEEEIFEEEFVGYDDEEEERSMQDRVSMTEQDRKEKHTRMHQLPVGSGEMKKRDSKRISLITCIVLFNLLLSLGIGTWLLLKYFVLDKNEVIESDLGPPALPPVESIKTTEDLKAELIKILEQKLTDIGERLDDKTNSQSEALDWLIKDPQIHTYDEQKILTRFALATFYYATDGDNWTTNHLWLSDLNECLWYTSSSENPCIEQRYSRLVLTSNNLQGIVPKELSLLSNSLVNLDLVGTFTGEIPSNIGDLAKLTSLRLNGRIISGRIPDSLYTLSDLSSLDLGRNLLSGRLSSAIATLGSLSSISVMDNRLTGSIPKEIGQLSALTHFNIDDNYFEVLSEEIIGQLNELEILSARNNVLRGTLPSIDADSLTNLKGLFLNNNDYTGSIPVSYGYLSKLEDGLDLSSNRLQGRAPESLGRLSMLKNLLLRDNALSGTIPLSWGKLSTLNTLRLDSTNFQGDLPTELCDSFNEASSSFYADCWQLNCPCCNFCCDGVTGECVCRFEDSLPILCVEP